MIATPDNVDFEQAPFRWFDGNNEEIIDETYAFQRLDLVTGEVRILVRSKDGVGFLIDWEIGEALYVTKSYVPPIRGEGFDGEPLRYFI